jgi:hypothetical protein
MRTFSDRLRAPAWVWALALLPRLILFGYVAARPVRAMVFADSFEYLALARNLALQHRFATRVGVLDQGPPPLDDSAAVDNWLISSTGPPFCVHMVHTPVYPLLAAPWHYLSDRPLFPVIPIALLQSLAGALVVVLCWRWGARIGGTAGANWAAVLMALEPTTFLHTSLLLTDTLHAACLALASLLFWRVLKDEDAKPSRALLSGLGYCAAIMIRPVSTYLPFLLCGFLLRRRRCLAAFLLGTYLLPGLWACRNYQQGGQLIVSCASADALHKIPAAMGLPEIFPAFNDPKVYWGTTACLAQRSMSSLSRQCLASVRAHPFLFGRMIGWHLFYFLEGTSLDMLVDMVRAGHPFPAPTPLRRFQFERDHPALVPAWIAGLTLLVLLYAAFWRGCWRLALSGRWSEALFLAGSVLYFIAVTVAPHWGSRYRMPIIPLLAVGASAGIGRKAADASPQA